MERDYNIPFLFLLPIIRDIRLKNNLKSDQIKFGQAFLFLEEVIT